MKDPKIRLADLEGRVQLLEILVDKLLTEHDRLARQVVEPEIGGSFQMLD